MKRWICILLALLLTGCGQRAIAPVAANVDSITPSPHTPLPTATATCSPEPATPEPTEEPIRALPTYRPKTSTEALFMEELLSQDGEPLNSMVRDLVSEVTLSKGSYYAQFTGVVRKADELREAVIALSEQGRTMTANRKKHTIDSLLGYLKNETLDALQSAYAKCQGEGEALPLDQFISSVHALLQAVQGTKERTAPFYGLNADGARDYLTVLSRYMGETVLPHVVLDELESLAQTEAYAINTALNADPEAGRKKERISMGSFTRNMALLRDITSDLCPLPDGYALPVLYPTAAEENMDLLELAFRKYPGMAYLKVYAAHTSAEQQNRWGNAPDGYLAGIAVHGSYAVIPYLTEYSLDYVQYRWYEDMLSVTLTGISALLIHYYGYSWKDLSAYLEGWGAADFTDYLYEKAMYDPFESLVASCGYYRYLEICQAALDAGCENEQRFLQDYLAAGPAPYEDLKEHMAALYQNQG